MNKIRNIFSMDGLSINQDGMMTVFQVTGKNFFGIQYLPDYKSPLWKNFLHICRLKLDWDMKYFLEKVQKELMDKIGHSKVLIPYSGGIKSTVLTILLHKIIPVEQLQVLIVDTGLFRTDEYSQILDNLLGLGINVQEIDINSECQDIIQEIDPYDVKKKERLIWNLIVNSCHGEKYQYLMDTRLYSDLEYHNWSVGGNTMILQPFRYLFRSDIQELGRLLGLSYNILSKHHFSPSGLCGRIIGYVTKEKLSILQSVDDLWINFLKNDYYYDQVNLAGASWISEKIISLWCYDEIGEIATISTDLLLKVSREIKSKLALDEIQLVYTL